MRNLKLLSKLSSEIRYGQAVWPLLIANENFSKESPVRKALVIKSREKLLNCSPELRKALADGITLSELPGHLKEEALKDELTFCNKTHLKLSSISKKLQKRVEMRNKERTSSGFRIERKRSYTANL